MNSFFLFDAARAKNINLQTAIEINNSAISLYRGRSEEVLAAVAPYIFTFPHSTEFADFIFENGWGNSWGVIFYSSQSMEDVFLHFRKFLMVKTEEGKDLYFRFYDPRVLKIFLPTCDKDQVLDFFGPIEKFIAEGNTKETAIEFTQSNGLLDQKKINVQEVFGKQANANTELQEVVAKRKKWVIMDEEPGKKPNSQI